jgi:hypothetical protein
MQFGVALPRECHEKREEFWPSRKHADAQLAGGAVS